MKFLMGMYTLFLYFLKLKVLCIYSSGLERPGIFTLREVLITCDLTLLLLPAVCPS